jgi:cellobiose phosphorylase
MGLSGESVWLNQFVYMAIDKMNFIYEKIGQECPLDVEVIQLRLFNAVQKQWTGEWFARGITEKGEVVGGEDRVFLLTQAWYTLSGMSLRDPEKGQISMDSMVSKLRNDNGLLLCYPPFDQPTESVGRLSFLAPGVAENFAIYNHAAAYGILALFEAGMDQEGQEFMSKILPFTKDWRKTRSEPFVLVNYYNGGYYDFKDGEGGIPWLTSTVSWLAITLFDVIVPKGKKLI